MREHQRFAAFAFCLTLFLCSHINALGDTSLEIYGVGAIEEDNLAKAEQLALNDAFAKALLHVALRQVPNTSSRDLIQILPDYIDSRGMQDIIQYKITSRNRQYDVLQLSVDIKLDEESLRDWLYAHALTVPLELRPKILLMITSYGPGNEERHEWWTTKGKKAYSSFEAQLSEEFSRSGENVLDLPRRLKGVRFEDSSPVEIAGAAGADLLLTGSISYTPVLDTLYECSMEMNLIDLQTAEPIGSWSASHRGDFPLSTMNALMIDEVVTPIRARFTQRMLSLSPVVMKKRLCVEGIGDYVTYQAIISALRAMESISAVEIESIEGHTICHTLKIKGSLFDIMENLKREQITEADFMVEEDTAHVRILAQ